MYMLLVMHEALYLYNYHLNLPDRGIFIIIKIFFVVYIIISIIIIVYQVLFSLYNGPFYESKADHYYVQPKILLQI
jgi:hypothetical protein